MNYRVLFRSAHRNPSKLDSSQQPITLTAKQNITRSQRVIQIREAMIFCIS